MVEPLRHRQTKGAETDMSGLPPPRHIPTLPPLEPSGLALGNGQNGAIVLKKSGVAGAG